WQKSEGDTACRVPLTVRCSILVVGPVVLVPVNRSGASLRLDGSKTRPYTISDCSEHCPLRRLRQLDGNEISLRIQVVFSRLIHYTHLTMLRGLFITQEAVNFPQFQRRRVAGVPNAEAETRFTAFWITRQAV